MTGSAAAAEDGLPTAEPRANGGAHHGRAAAAAADGWVARLDTRVAGSKVRWDCLSRGSWGAWLALLLRAASRSASR